METDKEGSIAEIGDLLAKLTLLRNLENHALTSQLKPIGSFPTAKSIKMWVIVENVI